MSQRPENSRWHTLANRCIYIPKWEFHICPRMDFDNILYVENLRYKLQKWNYFIPRRLLRHRGGGGGTLMYTLLVLIYDLWNISLKLLTLLTATFVEWNMKKDSPGYTLLSLMYMNTSRYFFSDPSKFELSPYWTLKLVSIGYSVLLFTMFQFLSTYNIFRKVGQIHPPNACKFS